MNVSAQDVIVKKDGSTIVCRVVEVTATEITYKKWSDLNGSNYVMDKSLASAINYQSGKRETFSETESLYKPNNQNDGEQAMNDKALLRLDYAASNPYKKVKSLRTIGWIGGPILLGLGIVHLIADEDYVIFDEDLNKPLGIGLTIGGIACSTGCLIAANHYARQARLLESVFLYQHDIPFSDGTSLSVGADMLSDCTLGSNTVGLGLRYNF